MFYQISLLLLLLAARTATVDSHSVLYTDDIDQQKQMWGKFKSDHSKAYESAVEEKHRFEIFLQTLKSVDHLNQEALRMGGNPVYGITELSDLSQDEFQRMYLSYPSPHIRRLKASKSSATLKLVGPAKISLIDWTGTLVKYDIKHRIWSCNYIHILGNLTTAVKDQGKCASCWAIVATAQIESDAIRTLKWDRNTPLSAAQLLECVYNRNGCQGGFFYDGFVYANIHGITTNASYPYDLSYYNNTCGGNDELRITADATSPCPAQTCKANPNINIIKVIGELNDNNIGTEEDMAAYVQNIGPLTAAVDSTYWNKYSGGVVDSCVDLNSNLNHEVQFVGVDTAAEPPYWKVRNSWGPTWGEKGFMRMIYGKNMCGLLTLGTTAAYTEVDRIIPDCPFFTASNTNSATSNYAVCSFMACSGDTFLITTVSPGSCKGDIFLRLFDQNGTQLASNDDVTYGNKCSQIIYTFASPGNVTCRPYEIREGCFDNNACSGHVYFAIVIPFSSGSGSYCPSFSVSNTNSATSNYAVCYFMACPGDTVSITTLGPGSCSNDSNTYLRLYDQLSGTQLAFNDDSGIIGEYFLCSQIIHTFITSNTCRLYEIREGCHDNTACSGRVYFNSVIPSSAPSSSRPTSSAPSSSRPTSSAPSSSRPTSSAPSSSRPTSSAPSSSRPTSSAPSLAPLSSGPYCPSFTASNTNSATSNYAVCTFMACPGDTILINISDPWEFPGDAFLRLYDPLSGTELAFSDMTFRRQIIYFFVNFLDTCRPYEIREGCRDNIACSGQVYFIKIIPSFPPTSAPSSSRPTSAPASMGLNCVEANESDIASLNCPIGTFVRTIKFASYGTPTGSCGAFSKSTCDSSNSMSVVTSQCLNAVACSFPAQNSIFGDPCPGIPKRLYMEAVCAVTPLSVCATVNEGQVATISCPSGTFVRLIKFASYGTPTGSCGAFSKSTCDSSNSLNKVNDACLNKASCQVSANKNTFGDPCRRVAKYLKIEAICNGDPLSVCATVNEGQVATISCPSGTFVRFIAFASYGTPTGSCGAFSKSTCDSSNSLEKVISQCLNVATCTVPAQNSVFGDPCPGIPKHLYIQATCGL